MSPKRKNEKKSRRDKGGGKTSDSAIVKKESADDSFDAKDLLPSQTISSSDGTAEHMEVVKKSQPPSISKPPEKVFSYKLIVAVCSFIVVAVGFFSDLGGFYSYWLNSYPINVDIAWYEKKNGELQLIPPDNVIVNLTEDDIISNRIPLPINLAVRNNESVPLKVTRVELSYEKPVKVESNGKAKIDPAGRLLIYEHNIGILENVGSFTPLDTIDIISIPFNFLVVPVIARSKDGVPMFMVTVLGYGNRPFKENQEKLRVKIFCENRPSLEGIIHIQLKTSVEILGLGKGLSRTDPITHEDTALFSNLPQEAESLKHWEKKSSKEGFLLTYSRVRYKGGIYQYIFVDGRVRAFHADSNGDGKQEYTMIDATNDGVPDYKAFYSQPELMLEWVEEGLK